MEILKNFDTEIDVRSLMSRLRIETDSTDEYEFKKMVEKARDVADPKAIYLEGYVETGGDDFVVINGVKFTSTVLRKNLDSTERVFVYVATCGTELDSIKFDQRELLQEYWWDEIKAYYLNIARKGLMDYLKKRFMLKKTASMVPGGSESGVWPIEQQKELFSLFGDVEKFIGVKLTDTFLMVPNKSVSGILFPTEKDYSGCKVCRRKNCPGRIAEFDENLWKSLKVEASLHVKK